MIRPAVYAQVRSTTEGFIALYAKDGQKLRKGVLWATLDPEQIEIERKSLVLEEEKLRRQIKKNRDDAREAQITLSLDRHEARNKRAVLLEAANNPEVPAALRSRATEALEKMDERLAMLDEKLDPAKVERDIQLDADEGELQIIRKRKQFEALEKRSKLVAEFAGELRLSDALGKMVAAAASPDELLWVKANEHLATIVDDEHYEISVKATGPVLSQIPRDEVMVLLQEGQTGKLIAGEYSRTDEIDSGAEIVQSYVFNIRENSVKDARHSVGQRNLVHVYRSFPQKLRLVQKKDIAFLAPEVLASGGWNGLVRYLWPGSEVVQVGPQAIAVKPKDEN